MGTDLITGGVPTSLFPVPSRTRSPSDYPASGWGPDGFPLALERARTSRGLNGKVSRSVLGPMPCQCKCRTGFLNCARSSHSLWLLAGRTPAPFLTSEEGRSEDAFAYHYGITGVLISIRVPALFPMPNGTTSPSDYPASGWGSDGSPLALERARTSRGLSDRASRSVEGPMPCQCKCRAWSLNRARSSQTVSDGWVRAASLLHQYF